MHKFQLEVKKKKKEKKSIILAFPRIHFHFPHIRAFSSLKVGQKASFPFQFISYLSRLVPLQCAAESTPTPSYTPSAVTLTPLMSPSWHVYCCGPPVAGDKHC